MLVVKVPSKADNYFGGFRNVVHNILAPESGLNKIRPIPFYGFALFLSSLSSRPVPPTQAES